MPGPNTVSVADVLDRIPVGRFHHRLLAICGAAWAFDGMEVIVISFTLPALTAAWGLDGLAAGVLGAASLMGMVAGNWLWGWYADRHGRKTAFQYTVLCYSVFAGLTALATGFYTGFTLRFLTGVGLGGALAIDTAYLSEHLPTGQRGSYLVYLDAFWPLGNLLAVGLAWFAFVFLATDGLVTLPLVGSVAAWRILFAISAFPALLVFVIRRELHETPYYLARAGRIDEANERLRAIAAENGSTVDLLDVDEVTTGPTGSIRDLFQGALRQRTLMIGAAWFAINFGYYGVFIWLPKTVNAAGIAVGSIYTYFVLIALVQIPGYLSAAYLVERWGRRPTLGVYLVASGVFTFVFAAAMPNISLFGVSVSGFWPFVLGLLSASFFTLGAWGAIYAYTPELFPTNLRATGNGYAGGVGKIAAVIGPILAGALVEFNYLIALTPLATAFVLGGTIVLVFGEETRGQALE